MPGSAFDGFRPRPVIKHPCAQLLRPPAVSWVDDQFCFCGAAQVGVSLVLSFMVVWDLPAIGAGIGSLRSSRLAPFYNEVAPSLAVFGQLFGKALQAQVGCPLHRPGIAPFSTFPASPPFLYCRTNIPLKDANPDHNCA